MKLGAKLAAVELHLPSIDFSQIARFAYDIRLDYNHHDFRQVNPQKVFEPLKPQVLQLALLVFV